MCRFCPRVDLTDLPVDAWPESAQVVLRQASVQDLLAADARAAGVRIGKSSAYRGGRGVFALRPFVVGERILPFFGQLVYDDLMKAANSKSPKVRNRAYGRGAFLIPASKWSKNAAEVRTGCRFWWKGGTYEDRLSSALFSAGFPTQDCGRSVWMVPADHCAAGIVNDYRHVHDESNEDARSAIVELVQR